MPQPQRALLGSGGTGVPERLLPGGLAVPVSGAVIETASVDRSRGIAPEQAHVCDHCEWQKQTDSHCQCGAGGEGADVFIMQGSAA